MGDREHLSSMDESSEWDSDLVPDDSLPGEVEYQEEMPDEVTESDDFFGLEGSESTDADPPEDAKKNGVRKSRAVAKPRRKKVATKVDSQADLEEKPDVPVDDSAFKPARGTSPGLLGFFYFLSVVAVAVGAGYAVLQVMGGKVQQLLEVQQTSFFFLTASAGGIVILGLLGALGLGNAVGRAGRRAHQAEQILQKITQLDLDEEDGWQDENYNDYPTLATSLYRLKSTHELLRVRHARAVELEMEVQRLEEAVTQRARSELRSEFTHPLAAQMADEAARLVKSEADLRQNLDELKTKLTSGGEHLSGGLRDACGWNDEAKQTIHSQTEFLAGNLPGIPVLTSQLDDLRRIARADSEVVTAFEELKDKLQSADKGTHTEELAEVASVLKEAVEKIAGVAFQIAINVARLGQDGVMLLPLTQQLEGMSTEFKTIAAKVDAVSGHEEEMTVMVQQVKTEIQSILGQAAPTSSAETTWSAVQERVGGLLANLRQMTQALSELPDRFDQQTGRLNELGSTSAVLTDTTYEPCVPTSCEPISLEIPEPDPEIETPAQVESSAEMSVAPTPAEEDAPISPSIFQPAEADRFADPVAEPAGESTAPTGLETPAEDATMGPQVDGAGPQQPDLSSPEDRVYDLAEFGAVALDDDTAAAAADADRIYDLEELGAVAVS